MTHFIPPADEFVGADALVEVKKAVDAIREIDMLVSSYALGQGTAQDVVEHIEAIGLGKMSRGEILKGGGYA